MPALPPLVLGSDGIPQRLQSADILSLSQIAVAAGATTPDPGAICLAWSTTLSSVVRWNGTSWNAVGGGGSGNVVTRGTFAGSRPASPAVGDQYLCTDAPYVETWTGTIWEVRYGTRVVTRPVLADFTAFNSGSFDQTNGVLKVSGAIGTAGANKIRGGHRALPTAPYRMVAMIQTQFAPTAATQYWGGGLLVRNAGGSSVAFMIFSATINTVGVLAISNFTNDSTQASSLVGWQSSGPSPHCWIAIEDDGANRLFRVSSDGYTWRTIHSTANNAFITPTLGGVCINPHSSVGDLDVHHFRFE